MVRLISWAVGFVFRTLWQCFLLGWRAVLFLLPFVIKFIRFVVQLVGFSVLSLFVGVPTTVRRMAASWTKRALSVGVPVEHEDSVYRFFAVWAFVVLLAGWMTLGSLVWVLWTRVLSYM